MRRWWPPPLFIALLIAPLAVRAAALYFHGVAPGLLDARGVLADVVLTALMTALLYRVIRAGTEGRRRWLGRAGAVLLLLLWTFAFYSNFEHVLANDTNVDPGNAKYLGNKEFLLGSLLRVGHPILLACAAALGVAAVVLHLRAPAPRRLVPWVIAGLVGVALLPFWPPSDTGVRWRQENMVLGLPWLLDGGGGPHSASVVEGAGRAFAADLSGTPRFAFMPEGSRPNVLLIMLEGITGAHVPYLAEQHGINVPVKMPKLSALAERNVAAATFIAPQRQTDRGEYALLCGDLPKLSRETPRMTEIALGGGNGPACLPSVLRERGYQTAYLQPAPMGFMMKDQFMDRVGFDQSLGAEHFTTGYAKGGWGIDDRAFFEQSLEVLRRLDGEGRPWFAALMTVGTHHPLVVPTSFRSRPGEDKFARAVRYTDLHLIRMVDRMRKAGMLDDTIVLITSDEARGIHAKYGGVTRTMSQNWSFLVALLPGGRSALLNEPYSQSDVALSLFDYMGLDPAPTGYLGRSLFRRYPAPRPLAFANIFKRRAFWLDGARDLHACDERFAKCTRYVRDDDRLFGPGWEEGDTDGRVVTQLQNAVAWSARTAGLRTAPAQTDLVAPNVALLPIERANGRRMYVFGGQFLYAPAGKKAFVDLDIEITGDGASVLLQGVLNVEYEDRYSFPKIPPMMAGDRMKLSFSYTHAGPLKRVDVGLFAKRLSRTPAAALVRTAQIRFVDLADGEEEDAGAKLLHFDVLQRTDKGVWRSYDNLPRTPATLSVHGDDGFVTTKCMARSATGVLQGRRCRGGTPVVGPYRATPPESQAKARYVLRGVAGEADVHVDLASMWGRTVHGKSEPVRLRPGETIELVVEGALEAATRTLEARLWVHPKPRGKAVDFDLLEGRVTIEPRRRAAAPE